jgi:M6 family metalloprotease-like protein
MSIKIINIAIALFVLSIHLFAVKAYTGTTIINQPDSTTLTIRLKGDEFFNYVTTEDGYLIRKNENGIFNYAKWENGIFKLTDRKANDLNKRDIIEKQFIGLLEKNPNFDSALLVRKALKIKNINSIAAVSNQFPITGSPRSLIILVNFSDKSFVTNTPKTAFTDLLNKKGYSSNGGTGSARDYFIESSFGQFSPQFDVVGPFNLPQSLDYYGSNDTNGYDQNPQQMILDACAAADAYGVDFKTYDSDNNNIVDNVFVYYAGYNEAEGASTNTIWPHRWSLANYKTKFDDKIIFDYACTSELRGTSGSNMCGIGTFSHEFGHVLGMVDYYHTAQNKKTLEDWSIMDGGAYLNLGRTPPSYSAYDRFYLGWLKPKEIIWPQNISLESIILSNNAVLISQNSNHNLNGSNPIASEFFIIENRKKIGFDSFLPNEGMLIWHIDYNSNAWDNNSPNNYTGTSQTSNSHMRVYLHSPINNLTTPGNAFTTGTFTPKLWNGTDLNKPITSISITNGLVNFKFMGGNEAQIFSVNGTLKAFSTEQGTPSAVQQFKTHSKYLRHNLLNLLVLNNDHFQIRKANETENEWRNSISITPINGFVDTTIILVRYNPKVPSYNEIHSDKILISTSNADYQFIDLIGTSSRKVYVVPPVATEATKITYGSYIANWNEVFDASGYFFTAYSITDGYSNQIEGFDSGLIAPVDWTITASCVSTESTYCGKSIPAIQLYKKNEYIQTEKFPTYASELSFFIKSIGSKTGIIKVEGYGEYGWEKIAEIEVNESYSATEKYTLTETDKFIQFRLTCLQSDSFYISIDDISVSFPVKLEYQFKNKWTLEKSDTLRSLISGIPYFYKIKASDLTFNLNNSIKYNNITDYSNIIQVNTLPFNKNKTLRIEQNIKSDEIIVFSDNKNNLIYIYNSFGQLIASIHPTDLKVNIRSYLKKNNLYLILSGNKSNKVIL